MRTFSGCKERKPYKIRGKHVAGSRIIVLFLLSLFVCPVTAQAGVWYAGEFSADIIITDPGVSNSKVHGTFHVGKDRFRAEGMHQGQHKVLIVHPLDHKVWMLFPESKTYYAGPGRVPVPPKPDVERLPGDHDSPCQEDKWLSCVRIGTETLNGIKTEKWEISHQRQAATRADPNVSQASGTKVVLWADLSRRIVIRQQTSAGSVVERTLVAMEKINGRQTEKWAFSKQYQGETQNFFQWVDAKLRVPVRDEIEGKTAMALVNIQEKPQPAHLFEIPRAFKEVPSPLRSRQQGGPEQGQPWSGGASSPPSAPSGTLQYH